MRKNTLAVYLCAVDDTILLLHNKLNYTRVLISSYFVLLEDRRANDVTINNIDAAHSPTLPSYVLRFDVICDVLLNIRKLGIYLL